MLLISWSNFLTNQELYPDLGSDTSSVLNFCTRSSDVISGRNQWWHHHVNCFVRLNWFRIGLNSFFELIYGRRSGEHSRLFIKPGYPLRENIEWLVMIQGNSWEQSILKSKCKSWCFCSNCSNVIHVPLHVIPFYFQEMENLIFLFHGWCFCILKIKIHC